MNEENFERRHKVLIPIRAASRDDNPRDNCYVSPLDTFHPWFRISETNLKLATRARDYVAFRPMNTQDRCNTVFRNLFSSDQNFYLPRSTFYLTFIFS